MALVELGVQPYDAIYDLQRTLVVMRQQDIIGDTVLLLEHAPVYTLGRRADAAHVLASEEVLAREGIAVRRIERGGDVTYHGPGQLVGYPILDMHSHNLGASDYMHRIEDVVAATCADFGIRVHRREKVIGLWAGENKIAALGVRIKRGVTFHGFALNVDTNMRHWSMIVPCGITDGGVTSMALELDRAPPMSTVRARVAHHMGRLFNVDLVPTDLETLSALAAKPDLADAVTRIAAHKESI